jgi:hypothetical protein
MQCYKLSVNEFTEFIDDAIEERRRLRAVVEVIKQLLGRHKSILLQYREQNSTPHLFDSLDGEKLVFQGMYSEKKQKSRS